MKQGTKKYLPQGTNVSDQLSVISNQFFLTDHFSLMTVHPWLLWYLSSNEKRFYNQVTK
jgi:hypothetical protein